ncbi:MAG: hypothetical protein JSR82_10535 [Verrucomicrobia bacterium]|nr:hypothetical protein [Verrucomicrobiota bacterium]
MNPLQFLQDVPGVLGAYFVNSDGRVAARLFPSQVQLTDEVVIQTAGRLQGILGAGNAAAPGANQLLLKHTKGILLAQAMPEGLLLVLVDRTVALPTLRAAVGLVLPQLALASRAAPPPERPPSAPSFSVPSLAEVRPSFSPPPSAPPPAATPPAKPPPAAPPKKAQKTRTGIWG